MMLTGYQLWAYFEESAELFDIELQQNRRPTEEEVMEAVDWRLRRRAIKPSGRGVPDEFFASREEAAKQAIIEKASTFNSPACRNVEFRLVEVGTEGLRFEPSVWFKLFEE